MLLRMLVDYGNKFRLRLTVWSCLLVATAVGAKYDAAISEHSILLSGAAVVGPLPRPRPTSKAPDIESGVTSVPPFCEFGILGRCRSIPKRSRLVKPSVP